MLPEMKLDTDTFQELIEDARTMLAGSYPEWTDYNYHDPGITFLELFAWLKENQQFHMEQLGDSHYEQFFKLLGFQRRGRLPARVMAKPQIPVSCHIPAGSRFQAGGMAFENMEEETLLADGILRVVDKAGMEKRLPSVGDLRFYPFGKTPQPGDCCTFFLSEPLVPGQLYHIFFQLPAEAKSRRNPAGDFSMVPLAKVTWSVFCRHGWKEIVPERDETKNFLFEGRLALRVEEEMAPFGQDGEYAIRVTLLEHAYDCSPLLSDIRMDQIVLDQKKSWDHGGEPFLIAVGNGFPNQEYALPWKEPMAGSVKIQVEDVLCPGRFLFWQQVRDFSECGPDAAVYMVDEVRGTLVFGDGFRGMAPEGRIHLIAMEETRGEQGSVKIGTLVSWEQETEWKFAVSKEIFRGLGCETTAEAWIRLNTEEPERVRAVTAEDYEELVKQTPGLMIYACKVLDEKRRDNQVSIVVRPGDGKENPPLSRQYRETILRFLDKKRLIGTRIRLLALEYIGVRLYLEVSVLPQYRQAREMILAALEGWFLRLGASFGDVISYGALYGMIDSMSCIRRLRVMNLEAGSSTVVRSSSGDLLLPANGVALLKQVDYTEISD